MFILSNILLKNNLPKIIDFGPGEGTVGYQSPELLGRLKYGFAITCCGYLFLTYKIYRYLFYQI